MNNIKSYLLLLLPVFTNAQSYRINYDIQQRIPAGEGFDILYEGTVIINPSFYLYTQKIKPQSRSLQIFPQAGQDQLIVFQPNQDSIPKIIYRSFDSSLIRYKISNENETVQYYKQVQEGNKLNFEIHPDRRTIQGFQCKKAIYYHPKNYKNPVAEVWYCSDIPISSGPAELSGVPGLVIEAIHYQTQEIFRLKQYREEAPEQTFRFWPSEFNGANFQDLISISAK
jgi:GLPGLI family protein